MFEKKKSSLSRISTFIINVSVFLIITSMFFLIINQYKINNDLEKKNVELSQKNQEIETLLSEKKIAANLLDTISAYTEAINKCDLSKTLSFYADSVERFFLKENVSIAAIEKSLVHFLKKNDGIKILFNTNSVTYNITENEMNASILKDYYDRSGNKKRILTEMKFNKDYKIIYIRDYYTK